MKSLAESSVLVVVLAAIMLIIGEPFWQTNDDPGMLMVVHQFGEAVAGTPPWLVHTNILWGYVLRGVPDIAGVLGYSIVNYLVTMASLVTIHAAMSVMGVGLAARLLMTSLFATWLFLFPQFTMNAGICSVAALALICACQKQSSTALLAIAGFFAVTGWLIRDLQFLLIAFIAVPFVISTVKERRILITGAITALVLASSWLLNMQSYQDDAWEHFNELNQVRSAYTDYDAVGRLLESDAATAAGYSENDLLLLRNWFFLDPVLADPERLQLLLDASPPASMLKNLAGALTPFTNYVHLWGLALATLILSLLSRSRRVAFAWILFLAAIIAISLAGRVTPERLIIPIYLMLCFFSLVTIAERDNPVRAYRLAVGVLAFMSLLNLTFIVDSQKEWRSFVKSQEEIAGLLTPRTVVWGQAFRSEIVHRPLQVNTALRENAYQSFSLNSLAPTSNTYHATRQGVSPLDLLRSSNGVRVVAFAFHLRLLETYCHEHLASIMEGPAMLGQMEDEKIVVAEVRCTRPL